MKQSIDPTRTARKLRKIAGHWSSYVVDGKLFTDSGEAIDYARRLAKVRGDGQWMSEVKVPKCLPERRIAAYASPTAIQAGEHLPPVQVWFVDGRPYLSFDDAETAADAAATVDGRCRAVMVANISMDSLGFELFKFGQKKGVNAEVEAAAA